MIVEARAVTKIYGRTAAVRGVSLRIDHGEIVAVTGPSGCGKTTLLHLLAGITMPDEGEVLLGDQRIDTMSETRRSALRRKDIGVLFQFGQIVAELSAVENAALPLLLAGVRRREATALATEWLDRLGIADLAEQLPGEMSGGQQQRVALARALASRPSVLFADEPTGALDSLSTEVVLTQLVRIARTYRTTVVLVTHDVQVAAYADREIRMRDGQLADLIGVDGQASATPRVMR